MTPERWQQINQLYQSSLELEASQRTEFLKQVCAGDEELRGEVESLLASHEQARSFIETPALEVAAQVIAGKQAQSMPGREVGSYKILSLLGRGGMGEVYRAKDTRLRREVAVKILPGVFSTDADRLRRFEQEARAAGRLNHPNVLAIYDVGTHEGSPYIVSELLEGVTLRARMKGTALPPRKVMEYAVQIARGLAVAHDRGIVHRDLKPENLFVTKDGRIKILDFGLAKLRPELNPTVDTAEPTLLKTDPGIVMGTVAYMSPEQVRGDETDHRSDIFSFGTVLYEMLSGQQAFQRKSAAETMSAILKEEPSELTQTNPNIPSVLEHIARRCLEKGREQRFQSASDLAFALQEVSGISGSALVPLVPTAGQLKSHERFVWIVVSVTLVFISIAIAALRFRPAPSGEKVIRFMIPPPERATFGLDVSAVISPSGHHLAFVAVTEGQSALWVRPLDTLSSRELPGTEGARAPFWSPDSRSIGFFAQDKLKKIEISGGPAVALCDVSDGYGGAWNREGAIVFAPRWADVLYRVSTSGGLVTPVTKLDPLLHEEAHRWPQFLPDGRHFVYSASSNPTQDSGIAVGLLDSIGSKRVLNTDLNATYAPPGYLLFVREGTLMAQPFDAQRLESTGTSFPVAERLQSQSGALRSAFSVSDNGILAYESGASRNRQLIWSDRAGRQLGTLGAPEEYWHVEISPDNKRVALEIMDRQTKYADVWLFDLLRGIPARFTFNPGWSGQPIWSPDASHIAFWSNRGGTSGLYQELSNGTGEGELLVKGMGPCDWSSDGRYIVYESGSSKTKEDLWVLPLFSDRKPFPFVQTEFAEYEAKFSPNGRWIAYISHESGNSEIYVQSFPAAGAKWRVSTKGGGQPRWRRDGKELFYLAAGKLMAVPVKTGPHFEAGMPKALFEVRDVVSRYRYDATADGQRFLVITPVEEATTAPITVVLNWTAGLKR